MVATWSQNLVIPSFTPSDPAHLLAGCTRSGQAAANNCATHQEERLAREDTGDKAETFIACHLLKAVEGWNDMGLGKFELGYLRDKEKREVDFLVAHDRKPWFLAEVKHHEESMSATLKYYQDHVKAPFAFQIVINADYVDADCFARPGGPVVVPARTMLSQLL